MIGAPGSNQAFLIKGPADGIFDNVPAHPVLVLFNASGGQLGASVAIAPRRRSDGRRLVYVGRPEAASPQVIAVLTRADFEAPADLTTTIVQRGFASGLGTAIAVADAGAAAGDEDGILLATEPTGTAGAVTGSLLGAPVSALFANIGALVRAIVPADLGAATAGTFAARVSRVRDVDGDGREDFLVGSPGLIVGGASVGAYFISGATRGVTGPTIAAPAGTTSFGTEVTSVGDIDGDGLDDLAFGAPDDGSRGRVFLRLSTAPTSLRTIEPPSNIVTTNARFGFAIAGVGDVDGDGRNEIMIGSPMDSLTATNVAACGVHNLRANAGDCAGGVYIVPSTHLGDNTAFPCAFPANGRSARFGTALRALGPSLVPALAPNHQRLAIGGPGLAVDAVETGGVDSTGSTSVLTFTWSEANSACATNQQTLDLTVAGTFFGEALAH